METDIGCDSLRVKGRLEEQEGGGEEWESM